MKSKFVLVLAIIMGLITTFLFYNYMKALDEQKTINNHMVSVVVAKQPIKKNAKLTQDMVMMAQLPEKGVHPQAIKSFSEVKGKFTLAEIAGGEVLLSHHLGSAAEERLFVSKKVTDGFRAVSVGVNFVQSVSNLIEPEDIVDVVFSEVQPKIGDYTPIKTEIILQKVRVLAVGRRLIETTAEEPYVEYTSVTLELKPEDTVKLVNASQRGNIQLILQSKVIPSK